MSQEDELITLVKVSEETGIKLITLQRAAQRKKLKATKPGRDWLTTRADVETWQKARRRGRPRKA